MRAFDHKRTFLFSFSGAHLLPFEVFGCTPESEGAKGRGHTHTHTHTKQEQPRHFPAKKKKKAEIYKNK